MDFGGSTCLSGRLPGDTIQLWDTLQSRPTYEPLDFQESKVTLWIINKDREFAWVGSLIPSPCAEILATPESHVDLGICTKLCDVGPIHEAVEALDQLVKQGCRVPNNLFYRVLRRCIALKDLHLGRCIHSFSVDGGYEGDRFLATHFVGLYAAHGRLEEAMRVFDGVSTPNAHNWAAIILAHAKHGEAAGAAKAIGLYRQMRESSTVEPDDRIYSAVLKACATAGDVVSGKEVHAHILARRRQPDRHVEVGLVDMYAKCGRIQDARQVFDRLTDKSVVTWTAMISGYAQQGLGEEALALYGSMQHDSLVLPNALTYASLMQACASIGADVLHEGKLLHAEIRERGLQEDGILGGSLVNMYAKCGSLECARKLFEKIEERSVTTWNSMIAGYAHRGMGEEALSLYHKMRQEVVITPNPVTYTCVLQACAHVGVGALEEGRHVHAEIREEVVRADAVLGGSLVNMYAKCGSIKDARNVFDKLLVRNVVTWNAMLAGYAQQGMNEEALALYRSMQQENLVPPDAVTFACMLQACGSVGLGALHDGVQLHARMREQGLQGDVTLGGNLVDMYAKCGSIEVARQVFDRLPGRTVVAWTAMLAGYAQEGMGHEALNLYREMQMEIHSAPDSVMYLSLLQACAGAAALPMGKQVHAEIVERGMQNDVVVGAALVNMYAKCGSMLDSQWVFESLPEKGVEAWSALIGGYARQGNSDAVFEIFERMKAEGTQPDGIAFLGVMTVCSHAGLVEKGKEYFESMKTEYGIRPTLGHLTCMIDILGRAGHVGEALEMAKTMRFPPDSAVWLTLLSACRKWNDVNIGQQVFELAVRLDVKEPATYMLMSDIYSRAGMWEAAKEMQAMRKRNGAWKKAGKSWWTDMGGVVHAFQVGDKENGAGVGTVRD